MQKTETDDLMDVVFRAQDEADAIQRPVHAVRDDEGRLQLYPEFRSPDGADVVHVALPTYRDLNDIKERNKRHGGHWFEPAALRFFASRIQERIYPAADGSAFFVSSERYVPPPSGGDDPKRHRRFYSVRRADPEGFIDTVGEFQGYETGRAAHAAAARFAAEWVKP